MLRTSPRERLQRWAPLTIASILAVAVIGFFLSGAGPTPAVTTEAAPPTTTAPPPTSSATTTTTPATTVIPATTTLPPSTTSPTTMPTTTTVPLIAQRGGSVRLGVVGSDLGSLNPLSGGTALTAAVAAATQAGAWRTDPVSLSPVPELVTEIPSMENERIIANDDGSVTVRLTIRPDAVWSDGTPVTGEDLRETARQLAGRSPYDVIEADSWLVGYKSVQFRLAAPTIRWLDLFTIVVPAHAVAGTDVATDWPQGDWPSAGPFVIASVDPVVVLAANPFSWHADPTTGEALPYLDELEVMTFPSAAEAQEALANGTVDVVGLADGYRFEPPPTAPPLSVATAPGNEYEQLGFQLGESRFDRNPRSLNGSPVYRNLVALLVDRSGISAEIGGVAELSSIVGASWPEAAGFGWPEEPLSADQVRAALDEVAAELGYDFDADAPEVRFNTTNSLERSLVAGVVTQELASGGVFVDVGLEDPGLFFRDFVIAREFDLALWTWDTTPGPLGAVSDLSSRFGDPATIGVFNFYGWDAASSPQAAETNAILADLNATMDLAAIADGLRRVDSLIAADMVAIPLYQPLHGAVFAEAAVAGVDLPAGGLPLALDAATWFVP